MIKMIHTSYLNFQFLRRKDIKTGQNAISTFRIYSNIFSIYKKINLVYLLVMSHSSD